MKKILSIILSCAVLASLMAGCSKEQPSSQGQQGFDKTQEITVVSREDGSGTRGAFVELTGVEQKNAEGKKEDKTTIEAMIANKTDVMLTNVANDETAIGYVSMGSLSDMVKAVDVDGVKAAPENVKNKTYTLARPFNIATKGEISTVAQDFIDFILSKQGQEVAAKSYISVNDSAPEYSAKALKGKVVVAGSSSVYPLMEKLKEAYMTLNPDVKIEVQSSDSTAGMTAVKDGICDIGMASRELKDSEKAELKDTAIALDGIAVVVNPKNDITSLTKQQIKDIYTGSVTSWDKI